MSMTPLLCLLMNRMHYLSIVISTSSTPTLSLLWKGKKKPQAPFLDDLLDNNSNQGIITPVFHKKTYTGLLTNFYSLVPFSYKSGLVCTLVDWMAGFHLDINNLTKMLRRNLFPYNVIKNVVRKYF